MQESTRVVMSARAAGRHEYSTRGLDRGSGGGMADLDSKTLAQLRELA